MSFEDELRDIFDAASIEGPVDGGSLPAVKARARQRTVRTRVAVGSAALALGVLGALAVGSSLLGSSVGEIDTVDAVTPLPGVEDSSTDESPIGEDSTTTTSDVSAVEVGDGEISAEDFTYVGSFRVPVSAGADVGAARFGFGGFASAVNANGDPSNADAFPGSLFMTGFPGNAEVAEISIPEPLPHDGDPSGLPVAELLQPFADVTNGRASTFVGSEDVGGIGEYRIGGLEVFDGPGGIRLHWTAWQSQDTGPHDNPGHGHSSLDLTNPDPQGPWFLGDFEGYETAGYVFSVPPEIANESFGGRQLISGFQPITPNAASVSQGPPLIAFSPPADAEPGSRIEDPLAVALYEEPNQIAGFRENAVTPGASWITTSDGRNGLITVGNAEFINVNDACGSNAPLDTFGPEANFYDPADLADAASGAREPHEVAPYETWDLLEHLIPTCGATIASISVDPAVGRAYVVQAWADQSQGSVDRLPVVHVFDIS